jgi:uncharacterized protein
VSVTGGGNGNGRDPSPPEIRALEAEFKALESSILLARATWLRQAGVTFGGARDEYEVLGYDRLITNKQYRDEYARGGIAGRVVDVMPDACWRGDPAMELVENDDPNTDTEFEKTWKALDTRLQICNKLKRVDRLARLSTYAVLLIGTPDGNLDQELPKGTPEKLAFLMPFSGGGGPGGTPETRMLAVDASCTIAEYDLDTHSQRFGEPLMYQLKRTDFAAPGLQKPVHWSRIIHWAEDLLEDEVFGQPALERVWNLLIDLRKITGGGAEAFWLRANQGMHLDIDKDMQLPDLKNTLEELKKQADLYKHQLDRWIRTKGVEAKVLGSDVANFANPADAVITQIAGSKAIPKRILTGSEMGELASSQDRENFKDQVNGRQTQHCALHVRKLVNRLITYGYLPTPKKGPEEYRVSWPHIQVLTEQEKSAGAKDWAATVVAGEPVFTDAEVRDKWYGMEPLTDAQRQELADRKAEALKLQQEAMAAAAPPAPAAPADDDDGRVLPFRRRAAEEAEDAELLRVLTAAIKCGNHQVIDKILGLQEYKYGSTQVQLPADVAAQLFAFGRTIPDEDLAEDGRETDAHVTVRYGLLDPDPAKVFEVVGRRGPVSLTLGQTQVFAAPEHDVVVLAVNSPDLAALHTAISLGVPCKPSDYPTYVPHATVAYVKSGQGHKYAGWAGLEGTEVTVENVVVTDVEGWKTEVSLRA